MPDVNIGIARQKVALEVVPTYKIAVFGNLAKQCDDYHLSRYAELGRQRDNGFAVKNIGPQTYCFHMWILEEGELYGFGDRRAKNEWRRLGAE